MKNLTKILTAAMILTVLQSNSAFAAKNKNPTFNKVRQSLWYLGTGAPSVEAVDGDIREEAREEINLPEELRKALFKYDQIK